MITLSDELKFMARGAGLCDQWFGEWGEPNTDELIDKFTRGIDFAIKHNFPTNEYIHEHFDTSTLRRHGVYVDDVVCVENKPFVVTQGKSVGALQFNNLAVSSVYARHDSNLTIRAIGGSKVFLRVYDNARVRVYASPSSKVFVYRYGGEIETDGNVIVRERNFIAQK